MRSTLPFCFAAPALHPAAGPLQLGHQPPAVLLHDEELPSDGQGAADTPPAATPRHQAAAAMQSKHHRRVEGVWGTEFGFNFGQGTEFTW